MIALSKYIFGSILLFACISLANAQTNITRVEYYVNTDPGYGNATPANLLSSPDVSTSFNVRADTLLPGLHIIGVRSRDANGAWSFDERWFLLKQAAPTLITNIEKVEWYVDRDPGYDHATALSITPGSDLINLSFDSGITHLSPGLHIIGVRSRSTNKAWSFDERWLMLKQTAAAGISNIERVEWYVDNDPGYGNATSVTITPGQDLINLSLESGISHLNPGLHVIGVRSRNTDNAWSFDERWLLLKQSPQGMAPNLKRIEYYIDADPGRGNGFPLAFLPAKDIAVLPAYVNITGLAAGRHKLLIRSQDANNAWSFDDTLTFVINAIQAAPFINVNSVAFTNVCAAGTFTLGYHATGTYNSGNQFIAEISDEHGGFANAQAIGNLTSVSNGGIIQCNMPPGIQQGSGFKMRVRSTSPPLTSNGSDQSLSVSISNFFLGNDTFKVVACAEATVDLTKFYNPANSTLTWTVANPAAAPIGIHSVFAVNSIGCKDTALISVNLPTATWTGTVSTNWHTPANWSTGAVPADTTHVIIPAEAPNECIISAEDAVAASVHVKSGAPALRILNSRKLFIKAACGTVPQ